MDWNSLLVRCLNRRLFRKMGIPAVLSELLPNQGRTDSRLLQRIAPIWLALLVEISRQVTPMFRFHPPGNMSQSLFFVT